MFRFFKRAKHFGPTPSECAEHLRALGYPKLFQTRADAIPPSFRDLWVLQSLVSKMLPSLVLEYGSGYSTYVIAETLRRIGHGRVISVELSAEWRSNTKTLLGDSASHAELISPEPRILLFEEIQTISFEVLHNLVPDLIFVDGPDPRQVPGYSGEPVVSDPLVFERHKPITICIDGRDKQCEFLDKQLSKGYETVTYRPKRFTVMTPKAAVSS